MPRELTPEQATFHCNDEDLTVSSKSLPFNTGDIYGQDKAIRAIRMGIGIKSKGYNIYVSGYPGTGRSTTVKAILEELNTNVELINDLCYVFNFKDNDHPILIRLPKGKGKIYARDVENFLATCLHTVPSIFESESFIQERIRISQETQEEQRGLFRAFETRINLEGFTLIETQIEGITIPEICPIVGTKEGNKAVSWADFLKYKDEGILDEDLTTWEKKYKQFKKELTSILNQSRKMNRKLKTKVEEFDKKWIIKELSSFTTKLRIKYKDFPTIIEHLNDMQESVIQNYQRFMDKEGGNHSDIEKIFDIHRKNFFNRYRVNLILDSTNTEKHPVIMETQPTFTNLFGTIERAYDKFGTWHTDFTRIKRGSLLKANFGYLIINAYDILQEPGVWKNLTRILKTNRLEIQSYEVFAQVHNPTIKPEAIELDLKVILIGDESIYSTLLNYDIDFRKIFKIKAQFDSAMPMDTANVKNYVSFIKRFCKTEGLFSCHQSALKRIIEFSVRMAGRQKKLSTIFSQIANLIRDSHYFCLEEEKKQILAKHVEKAIQEEKDRHNLFEIQLNELIETNGLLLSTSGSRVGQINGLTVYDLGDYMFGKPSRITAITSIGKSEIINVERESNLSGSTHDKGVMIISGFLRYRYGQELPLSVSISICFEQSYSWIDGDSASSAEIFAILSSLADLPIDQHLAATGSVNQFGDVQSIGGVNEKVEGFFDLCHSRGLDGHHGVIIPETNVEDLILKKEVIDAMKKGLFHIYPISTIDEGIQILTGVEAGVVDAEGKYPENTVNFKVMKKLEDFFNRLENTEQGKEEDEETHGAEHPAPLPAIDHPIP